MNPTEAQTFEGYSVQNATILASAAAARGCDCEPYRDWFTFKRWLAQGLAVQKGEKGTCLQTFRRIEEKDKKTGEVRTYSKPWRSYVFCRCQVAPKGEKGNGKSGKGSKGKRGEGVYNALLSMQSAHSKWYHSMAGSWLPLVLPFLLCYHSGGQAKRGIPRKGGLMETYTFEDYTLTLEYTGEVRDYHSYVRYTLTKAGEDAPIFQGDDLGIPRGDDPEGVKAAAALLDFLTLQEGDTDQEYFDSYTERQSEFSECEAEDLRWWGYSLVCPQCGTVEPQEQDVDFDNPPAWALGQDPSRCDWCGSELD